MMCLKALVSAASTVRRASATGAPAAGGAARGQPGEQGGGGALGLVGRKGRDYFKRFGFQVCFEDVGLFQHLTYGHAQAIARAAIEEFTTGHVGGVWVVYNEVKSVMQPRGAGGARG